MRATLHDELMREAGFESDYDRDLAERRDRRRHALRRDILRATRVAGFVGLVAAWIIDTEGKSGRIPWALWLVLGVLATTGALAQLLQRRMTRDETRRHGLRRMWRAIIRPWRDAAR